MFFPSTACLVQDKLGAKGAWGFDLSGACSAFVYALQAGAQFVSTGAHKRVLVIGADVMSSIIDYTDRATCIIFGDGAGAVILEPADDDSVGLIDFLHEVDGSGGCSLLCPAAAACIPRTHETVDAEDALCSSGWPGGFQIRGAQDGGSLRARFWQRNGFTGSDIDVFIPHQANQRIIKATAERLSLPAGERDHQHRPLRQHHRRDHSAGNGNGA